VIIVPARPLVIAVDVVAALFPPDPLGERLPAGRATAGAAGGCESAVLAISGQRPATRHERGLR
jgi:hypothetical protein